MSEEPESQEPKRGRPKGAKNKPKRGRPKMTAARRKEKERAARQLADGVLLPSIKKLEEKETLAVLSNLEASVIKEKHVTKKTEENSIDRYLDDEKLTDAGYNTHTDQIINQEPIDPSFYYRGSKNVPVAGAQYQFTSDMVEQLRRCKEDIVYFAENFFYIVSLDRGKEKIKLYEAQKNVLRSLVDDRFVCLLSCRQSGKALDLETPISTTKGWKKLRELTLEDQIYGSCGQPINITHLHPIEYNRPCYKVTFDNGETIIADENHEWFTQTRRERNKSQSGSIKTTKQIKDSLKECKSSTEPNHRIPMVLNGFKSSTKNHPQKRSQFHYIVDVQPCESVPVRCITVDSSDSLFLAGKSLIPTHNSTMLTIFVLWMACFNDDHRAAIVANKESTAINIFKRVRMAYEQLPNYIKPGVKDYGKTGLTLGNDSSILVSTTTATSIRGDSLNTLAIDEAAFIERHILDEFWSSVIPAISSGKKSKILMVSTPNSTDNKFYEIFSGAENGSIEQWKSQRIDWWQVPGRDEQWKKDMVAVLGSEEKFLQEFGNHFLDNAASAVGASVIEKFKQEKKPAVWTSEDKEYTVFEYPDKNKLYVIGVDVGEGIGRAASVAQVLDVTDLQNIKQVAVYGSSIIEPYHFANKLSVIGQSWGLPPMLIERNNCGAQVIDALHYKHNYEKIVAYSKISEQDKYNKTRHMGVLSHTNIRFDGVQNMRYWVNHLQTVHVNDPQTISEFETFVKQPNGTYRKRNDNFYDDRIMSLVWALFILEPEICQQYFEIVDYDMQHKPLKIKSNGYWENIAEFYELKQLDQQATIVPKPLIASSEPAYPTLGVTTKDIETLDKYEADLDELIEMGYEFL